MSQIKTFIAPILFTVPLMARAALFNSCVGEVGIIAYICSATSAMRVTIPLIFALAILFFFYGMLKFMLNTGDEEALSQGKQVMFWGIVGIFVASSLWGIISVFNGIFGINTGGSIQVQPF